MPSPPLIASRYAVQKTLGEGGFGKTLLVLDKLQGDRPFVLKVLPSVPQPSVDREFRLLKSLYHPQIVEVVATGHLEDKPKSPYLVMEYVEGEPLAPGTVSLADNEASWGPIAQLCRTLSYIHSQKVIHGDLKPSNILFLKRPAQIKVIDFGLATLRGSVSAKDLPAGTLAYLAPEVIRLGTRSTKSDLYALGLLLYQLLRGRLPFSLSSEAAIQFHLHGEPSYDFLSKHPWRGTLTKILELLLHKDLERRPSDPLEVLTLLNEEAKCSFEIHRGWQETQGAFFFQKIQNYLDSVNPLLRLPSVTYPRSFLEEERQRIEKYLAVTETLPSKETASWIARLGETKARLLLQEGHYDDVLRMKGDSAPLRNVQALAEVYLENYEKAEAILQKTLQEADEEIDRARAENYLGLAAYNRGQWDKALSHFRNSLEEMKRLKDTTGIVSNAMNLAAIDQQQGKITEALQRYKEALTAAETLRNSYLLTILLSNIANLHLHVGALDEAEEHLKKSQLLADELNLPLLQGYNRLLAADLSMWKKDFSRAERELKEAAEIFRKIPSPMYLALAWINSAENAFRARQWGLLPERLLKASQAVSKTHLPEVKFRCEILKLRFQISQSQDLESVPPHLERLEKKASSPKERFQLLVTKAQWALARKDDTACEGYLAESKSLFEKEQGAIPVASRSRLAEAPRYTLFWELQAELARRRKAPADASLWRLIEVNKRLVATWDSGDLYELILDAAIELLAAERGFLIMPEYGKWKRGTWKVQTARHFRKTYLPGGRDLLSQTVIRRILERQKPLLVHNAQEEKEFREFRSVAALRLRSILAVPIVAHGEMIGALYLDHSDAAHLFEAKDLEILKAFADQAGIAITQARQYEEAIRQRKALEETRTKLMETNRRLEEELAKKSDWAEKIEEELKKVQTAGPIVARSQTMRHILKQIPAFARLRRPVILTGELGCGKDLLAKLLHQEAGAGPFVHQIALNLPPLQKPFEEANGGTLYLDEISDLPIPYQRDLLNRLQTQEELKDRKVFVILSSRTGLKENLKKEILLPELYRTLAGSEIRIPPLRERKEDLGPLVHHFLKELAETRAIQRDIGRPALGILHEYDWPGNIQELKLEVERAALASDVTIGPTDLSPNLLHQTGFTPGAPKPERIDLQERRARFERDLILQALERTGGNKARAAKRLGLSRAMLYVKIRNYKIPLK